MNKESLRKLLEDCWRAGCNAMLYDLGHTATKPPDRNTFINTRLAALDDKKVDDGQEGKGLDEKKGTKDAVSFLTWFDDMVLAHRIKHLKGEPRFFFNHKPDEPEGKQLWQSYSPKSLYEYWKFITEDESPALPVADGEGGKVDAGFIKYLVQAKNDFVKTVVELYPHEVSQPDKPERIKMRVACENIIIAYDQMKHKFTSLLPSAVTGGVKWVKGDVFVTTFWGEPEVCIIHSFTETGVNFIRLESIKDIKDIKDNYCSAGLIKKIFDGMNKTFIHHSTWYSEYRDEPPSPTPAPQEGKNEKWRRYRFETKLVDDYRPLIFNPKYPWWCSGHGTANTDVETSVIIAYLPISEDLTKYWDDAFNIEYTEHNKIEFTERFHKPDYYKEL